MNRGPYDLNESPFPGEPHWIQLLALFPDDDDMGRPYYHSSPTRARESSASPKPASAEPILEPSLPRKVGSARGHNRKA
jgi:hypothetical protein